MNNDTATISPRLLPEVETLWDYLQMHHDLKPADVGIGLGSHDPTVPQIAVDLYQRGYFPLIVFTGANAPTTIARYPRGEAVHYGEYAQARAVPAHALLLETHARHTAENITLTKQLLADHQKAVQSVTLICRPYQQRRAFGICRRLWPSVQVTCASTNLRLSDYVGLIGDADLVVNMIVGDLARLATDAASGNAINQMVPSSAAAAYQSLVASGYTARL
jgi:uncharacterized SAM-binding protein YcdF (DUF218 family)